MLGDQALELADELAVATEGEIRVDAVLERGQVELVEPADLSLRPRFVGELGERRAAPELEGIAQDLRGGRRRGSSRLGRETFEALEVETVRLDEELVPPGRVTITSSPSALRSCET